MKFSFLIIDEPRANVRVDSKDFVNALSDYDKCIELMSSDGEDKATGRAQYVEYPDTFVGLQSLPSSTIQRIIFLFITQIGRALAKEGLADWAGALKDYDKAIVLWGGISSENIVPNLGTSILFQIQYTTIVSYLSLS